MVTFADSKHIKIDSNFGHGKLGLMYGTIYESMYTGSMRGAGALMFAVWPYVLAHMRGNRDRSVFTVELNAEIIAFLIGESQSAVEATIERCCQPDLHSRSKVNEGRKLIKLGEYSYEVVNGAYYDKLKQKTNRMAANRRYQEEHRRNARKPARLRASKNTGPLPGEKAFSNAHGNGASEEKLDQLGDGPL